ncbi:MULTISPECIES: GNAT family N-acetyltransferase [unclassified Mammaliicoccus]|uniref:GNAT family N-acetyltransferase n=1 Tax=unclassified Mammaliicoccus TaxID=2803851 RepID=UPI001EFA4E62
MSVIIRKATHNDIELVTNAASTLLTELSGKSIHAKDLVAICEDLLTNKADLYPVFLALKEEECLGLLTLHEVSSLYAAGSVAIIQELYVQSNMRSQGIGEKLIQAAKEYGFMRNWIRLEVGAPDPEKWSRTVSFL